MGNACTAATGGRWRGDEHRRLWRGVKQGDRPQDFAAITKDDAEVFQIRIRQVREGGEVDSVGTADRARNAPRAVHPLRTVCVHIFSRGRTGYGNIRKSNESPSG